MPENDLDARVAAVRHFNRFYTRQIGLLQDGLLKTPFSLAEARVLYELAHRGKPTATELAEALGLDQGYLSRILRNFSARALVTRTLAVSDRRQSLLSLTAKGRLAFNSLDQRSHKDVAAALSAMPEPDQRRLVGAMGAIENLMGRRRADARVLLRAHKQGDMGWVVARHGTLYALEYGWSSRIEALTADIVSTFLKNFDSVREYCWIAELDGEPVGSVFLVRETDEVARLRLLLVEPRARGLGVGRDLVEQCIGFARKAGYRKITLWTHGVLVAARAIYQRAGFTLVEQWVHDDFGKPEPSETWERSL